VAGTLLESYNRLAAGLLFAVRALGLPAEIKTGRKQLMDTANPVCFEAPSAYEITVNGKKLVGSAQARRREGVLQHGSLPLVGELSRITQALIFDGEAARQAAGERLLRRATTAETVLGRPVSWDAAADAFCRGFEHELDLQFRPGPLSESEAARAEVLMHEKYAHHEWTRRI
jgi:lipoate-protein ligase A